MKSKFNHMTLSISKYHLAIILLLLCITNTGAAQSSLNDSVLIPRDSMVEVGILPNGLTYYLKHNNWPEKRACFYLAQKVGSLQEKEEQRGLAHFLEHMCFNGSEHFEGNEIEHFCESLGLSNGDGINAFTSIEKTVYYIDDVPTSVGKEKLDSCLLILYDWANGLTLDSIEIEKERGIVHEEWRTDRDAFSRIYERQLPILYPNSRYGHRLPIGLMDVVDNFKHQELRDYYENWYNPENQCIIVVGDIDVEQIEHRIKEIFGSIKPSSTPGIVSEVDVNDHQGIIFSLDKDKELQDNTVFVLFKHKSYTPQERRYISYWKDSYKTEAAVSMLNTRLSDVALKSDCAFLSAWADDDDYFVSSTKSAFQLYATSKDSLQAKAMEEMIIECNRAVQYGFTNEEFKRYQDERISQLDNLLLKADKRENQSLAQEYYNNYLYGTDISTVEDYISVMKAIIHSIPLEEINLRMKELMPKSENNIVIGCWSIEKEGAIYPAEKELHQSYLSGLNKLVEPYVDDIKDACLLKEIPVGGEIDSCEYHNDLGYTKLVLSNGATVLLKKTEIEKSQILFKAYGKGGWTLYNEEDDPNIIMLGSIPFGINGLSSSQCNKLLAGKRVSLGYSISQRTFTFTGSSNPNDLETFMQLIYADFTNISKDEAEYQKTIESTALSIRNSKTVPESAFSDSVTVTSNGHHPRFKILEEEDLAKVNINRIHDIIKEQTSSARNYTFIFVGNYDSLEICSLSKKYLASLPNIKEVQRGPFIKTWLQNDAYCHFSRKMETPKAMVQMEWFTESIPYSLRNSLLANMTCKILNMVYQKILREENSATYGCDADYYLIRGNNNDCQVGFSADCSMQPEKCDSVISMMKHEFLRLSTDIDDKMFRNAKEIMLKDLDELEKTKNGFWLDIIWQKENKGIDLYTDRRSIIKQITPFDIIDFVRHLQSQSHFCETVMRPK
jgi:zinc protease